MFWTKLHVTPGDKPNVWILLDPFTYETKDRQVITVPEGFDTDFASIPRPLWAFYPPTGAYKEAAVIHDYMYYMQRLGDEPWSREKVDALFLEAMEELGIPYLRRKLFYYMVRSFGWKYWNKRQDELDNETV
jgi:hypothetical protein